MCESVSVNTIHDDSNFLVYKLKYGCYFSKFQQDRWYVQQFWSDMFRKPWVSSSEALNVLLRVKSCTHTHTTIFTVIKNIITNVGFIQLLISLWYNNWDDTKVKIVNTDQNILSKIKSTDQYNKIKISYKFWVQGIFIFTLYFYWRLFYTILMYKYN